MKKLAVAIIMVSIMIFAGSAMADTNYCPPGGCTYTTWTLTDNPSDFKLNYGQSYQHTFNITTLGFDPAYDSITNGSLKVWLYDDGGRNDGSESAYISFDNWWNGGTFDFHHSSETYSIDGWTHLNVDGTLTVYVTSTLGDFYFDKWTLEAKGYDCPGAAVPEPSTMLLLGFGLAGAAYARKRFKK